MVFPMIPRIHDLILMLAVAGLFGLVEGLSYAADQGDAATKEKPAEPQQEQFTPAQLEFFEKEVRPLLVKHCDECHGPNAKRLEGGLLMTGRADLLAGGDTGPAVVPGKPKDSLLIDAVNYGELYEMPPQGKLPAGDIAVLTRWVEMGAPWPGEESTGGAAKQKFDLAERAAEHWAWRPITDPPPPKVKQADWPLDPIDHFLLARMEAAGLSPNAPADPRTLIRRLTYDLTGLPPTAAEIEEFLQDAARNNNADTGSDVATVPRAALERLVDRLLDSPRFGERWGRHWLDLMRYAESRGHEFDYNAPNAWQYRDYVIRALNADVPYDQFVVEHVAGDLLKKPRLHPDEGFNESIIATGFWHLGEWVHSPVEIRADEADRQDNMIDVFGKTFLGMTIACARCHDHKFDAISQRDYYALAGFLQSSAYRLARFDTLDHNLDVAGRLHELRRDAGRELVQRTAAAQQPVLDRLADYLLAARQANDPAPKAGRQDEAEVDRRAAAIAAKRGLHAGTLQAWVKQLRAAGDKPDDPLHVWARLGGKTLDPAAAEETIANEVTAAAARHKPPEFSLNGAELIIDYQHCPPQHWLTDGAVFGAAPVIAGTPLPTTEPASPLAGLTLYGAARRDPAFDGLNLAAGMQNDQGRVGKWQRAGRSIRTPTFTVQEGPVHYLVRGAGRAFAVVDSHRLVQGPLHGEVLTEWKDDGKTGPRWITHNLSRHQGHRVHVEFSPVDRQPLEVLMVAAGPRPTDFRLPSPAAATATALAEEKPKTPAELAAAYERTLSSAITDAGDGFQPEEDPAKAALADWMIRRPDLFIQPGADSTRGLQDAGEQYAKRYNGLVAEIRKTSRLAMAMWDGAGEDETLLIRGNPGTPGPRVKRRLLTALGGEQQPPPARGSGRLELAEQLVDPANPLTARVMANRVWHHLTGRGVAPTVDNFGVLGQEPSHPLLLDHLATRLVREGWSVKQLIKAVVMSRAYQMSSRPNPAATEIDPANRLLHRMRIRRLQGEALRDTLLSLSGGLDLKMYGPSVPVHLTSFMTGRGRPPGGPLDGHGRRSIYIAVRRNFLSPMMLAFDTPAPFSSMGARTVTNVPAQALIMMNDPLVIEQTRRWAQRALAQPDLSPADRVALLYEQAYARRPTEAETAAALAFLSAQAERHGVPPERGQTDPTPWADLCHVLVNVKEFIFLN